MNMSKSKVTVATAVVAATMVLLAPVAEAGRGGMRHGGGMMRMSSGNHHHHHHRRHFRPIYVAPVVTEKVYSERRTTVTQKPALVKFADGKGRMFDPASGVWFDGKANCWSGKSQWTFKTGAWFYGSYRWYEAGGLWQTDAPEAPVAVDCGSVPVFAAKVKPASDTSDTKGGREEIVESAQPERVAKTAEKRAAEKPAKAAECKKYFPSVGATLPVPCE